METTHFKELLHLVDFERHEDYVNYLNSKFKGDLNKILNYSINSKDKPRFISTLIKKVNNEDIDFSKFKNEFEKNLFKSESLDSKKFVFRYYLIEISKKMNNYKLGLILDKKDYEHGLKLNSVEFDFRDTLNEFEKYIYKCQFIYNYMFQMINEFCILVGVDFYLTLKELNIDLKLDSKSKFYFHDLSNLVNDRILPEMKVPETIEPEPPIGKITAGQKYYLLEKLGLFDNGLLKGNMIKIEDKQLLVSKLLGVNIRTARAFMNNDEKYIFDPNKKNEIDNLLKKITNSKG